MNNLSRLIRTTTQRISRNPYHSVGAVFVMFLTFFVGGIFVMISLGSDAALSYFESKPQIDAFFKEGTSQGDIDSLEQKLVSTGKIENIKFISKEEALKIYKERNQEEPLLTEFVTSDILPASFQISTKDINDLEEIADIVSKEQIVEDVVFQKDVVKTLSSWTKAIRNVGASIVVFLIITSILTTLIVISLNISLHKDEIETMRLVGATEWYIRTPFIMEGIFYGVSAAILATAFVWLGVYWISPFLDKFLADIPIFPINQVIFLYLLLAEITFGIIIGSIGALIATRKYLKV
ncbi:MAG: permease-like cell division protein FtsX [Candidatus Woykebacteria bacterium]